MKGRHEVVVENRRIRYRFTLERNITILRGDNATGKTTLIEMIEAHQRDGTDSGVIIRSDIPCVVLSQSNWKRDLEGVHQSAVFIDDGAHIFRTKVFAQAIEHSDNYYLYLPGIKVTTLIVQRKSYNASIRTCKRDY